LFTANPEDKLLESIPGKVSDGNGPPQLATDSSSEALAAGAKQNDDFARSVDIAHIGSLITHTMSAVPPEA
jgi:hypothetical protein